MWARALVTLALLLLALPPVLPQGARLEAAKKEGKVVWYTCLALYQVRIDGADLLLRVSAPPPRRAEPGNRVSLSVPAAACVILAPEAA